MRSSTLDVGTLTRHLAVACEAIHKVHDFAGSSLTLLSILQISNETLVPQSFTRGSCLIREGDVSDAVYLVCAGSVRLVRFSPGGLEVFLAHRTTGDLIGESGLISGAPRNCSIFAEDDVTGIRISRAVFDRLLENRAFVQAILIQLAARLTEASERAFSVSALSIPARVAAELLRRAARDSSISGEIAEPVIITELAFQVSATRESVSKIVNAWIRDGVLRKSGIRLAVERADTLVAAVEFGL